MKFKRITTFLLATTMVVGMLSGCNKKATLDDLVAKTNEKALEWAKAIDDAVEDSELTYDETKEILGVIPEGTYNFVASGEGELTVKEDEQEMKMKGGFNTDFDIQFDADEFEFSVVGEAEYNYKAMGMKGNQGIEFGVYLVKEDDEHYIYMQIGEDIAVREYVGDMEESFGEPLDFSEFAEEMDGQTFEDVVNENIENNYLKELMELQKETKEYNGEECYVVNCNITSDWGKKQIETSFKETEMSFEEMLDEELSTGVTMEDILNCFSFQIQYYYTMDDYQSVYTSIDMKDVFNDLVDLVFETVAAEEENKDMDFEVDVKSLEMSLGFEECEVDIKFEGDYIEAEEEEDDAWDNYEKESESDENVVSNIDFDENVKLEYSQIVPFKCGEIEGNLGEVKLTELDNIGFVDFDGNLEKADENIFNGYAKDVTLDAYSYDESGVIESIMLFRGYDFMDNIKDVEISVTEFGISIGDSEDALKVLGEPTSIDNQSYGCSYIWDLDFVEEECSLDVMIKDGIIYSIRLDIY